MKTTFKESISFFFKVIVLFFFLFEFSLVGPLTTRRVAILIALITLFIINKKESNRLFRIYIDQSKYRTLIGSFLFLGFLSFINVSFQSSSTNRYFEFWYIINEFLYIFIFAFYQFSICKSIRQLAYIYFIVFLIQLLVVMRCLSDITFLLYIYQYFNVGSDKLEMTVSAGTRIMGIGLGLSNGSITCSSAAIIYAFAYLARKINIKEFFVFYIPLILVTLFIGRTGVLIELVVLGYVIYRTGNAKNVFLYPIAALLFISLFENLLGSTDSSDRLFEWMTASFTGEGREETLNGIAKVIPPFCTETIFGNGIMRGVSNTGLVTGSDSGYVMMYSALGVIGSSIYYLAYYKCFNPNKTDYSGNSLYYLSLLSLLLMFLIEYKEPFILFYIFPYTLCLVLLLNKKLICGEL